MVKPASEQEKADLAMAAFRDSLDELGVGISMVEAGKAHHSIKEILPMSMEQIAFNASKAEFFYLFNFFLIFLILFFIY